MVLPHLKQATPNEVTYLMTPDGLMMGSSANESAFNPLVAAPYPQATVNMTTPFIQFTSKLLLATSNNNLFTLPPNATYTAGGYIFEHLVIRNASTGLFWICVSGAPLSDYMGNVSSIEAQVLDSLKFQTICVIVVSLAVIVVGVVVAVVLGAMCIANPLTFVTAGMKSSTRFDFSAVRKENLEKQTISMIEEISDMQIAFQTMVLKFANAITANKALSPRVQSSKSFSADS
ncbi:hypothetical protein HK101_007829 [Irineochytrium annulatum]|nr:hypothetical protein HK101_007829 [Irineochytrium annulatum]